MSFNSLAFLIFFPAILLLMRWTDGWLKLAILLVGNFIFLHVLGIQHSFFMVYVIATEEGVGLIKRYDTEFPAKYFEEILEYMGITAKRFWECINKGRSPHLWKYEDGEWKLRHPVWESTL